MTTLAIVFLVLFALCLAPGSAYKQKPEVDFHSPKLYMTLALQACGIALAVWVIVA